VPPPRRDAPEPVPQPSLSQPTAVPPLPPKVYRNIAANAAKRARPKWVAPVVVVSIAAALAVAAYFSKPMIEDWWNAGLPDADMLPSQTVPETFDPSLYSESTLPRLRPAYPPPETLPKPTEIGQMAVYWPENGCVYFVPAGMAPSLGARARTFATRRAIMEETLRKVAEHAADGRRQIKTADQMNPSDLGTFKLRARHVSDSIMREWAALRALERELNEFTEQLDRSGKKVQVSSLPKQEATRTETR
jgi:hypothetical protein